MDGEDLWGSCGDWGCPTIVVACRDHCRTPVRRVVHEEQGNVDAVCELERNCIDSCDPKGMPANCQGAPKSLQQALRASTDFDRIS